jgi:hypothetical protein
MRDRLALLSRRRLLAALAASVAAPPAFALGRLAFPLRLVYARAAPEGLSPIPAEDERIWTSAHRRAGGLIEAMEPLQVGGRLGLLPAGQAELEASPERARRLAAEDGYPLVLLYAAYDGRPPAVAPELHWSDRAFAQVRTALSAPRGAFAEAHLLDAASPGAPIFSITAEAGPRTPANLFEPFAERRLKALEALAAAFEQRVQDAARPVLAAQRTIAD